MIYVHLLNQEFPSKWPPPLKLDKFKGDGSQYPFVEEYQTYKQLQYPQFNSRIPQNRNIGQRNYQTQSRNTYLPRPQNNYRKKCSLIQVIWAPESHKALVCCLPMWILTILWHCGETVRICWDFTLCSPLTYCGLLPLRQALEKWQFFFAIMTCVVFCWT